MFTASDMADFYGDAMGAVSATYLPKSGLPKVIPVLMDYDPEEELRGSTNFGSVATMRIQAQGDDGVSLPETGDEVEIDASPENELWGVVSAKRVSDGLEWACVMGRKR